MFCIAAFIVFAILGLFSATYRPLAKKAWACTLRRVTFRPCDVSFGEEVKGRLIGRLVFRAPRFANFLDRWLDWLATIFVVLSVWSLVYVLNSGLNLWVYGTCNPSNAESCSLSGEACGVDQAQLGLRQAVMEGRVLAWAAGPFTRFATTISRIPDRLKEWNPQDYLSPTKTFYRVEDPAKPYVLEIVDPGCKFCKKLTGNLLSVGVHATHNLSYLLYPIPSPDATNGTKFPHSTLVASYVEATKGMTPAAGDTSVAAADWQLLEKIFTGAGTDPSVDLQMQINIGMTRAQAVETLHRLLKEIGFSEPQVADIAARSSSDKVKDALLAQKVIVEEAVRTIRIPTLLIGGRRYDRVVDEDTLKKFQQ